MITNGRVKELQRLLSSGRTLGDSARMAEMSEKTARKYRDGDGLASQRTGERKYRTRIDPFEGIWACASLLHVAEADLAGVIDRLAAHLVPGGALYLSFKRGTGERMKDGRRFTDMTAESLAALLDGCGAFSQPTIWESRDCRTDRASEVWLNSVVKKR
jgi:hypothetical protein